MKRPLVGLAVLLMLCVSTQMASAQRGKEGGKQSKGGEEKNSGAKKSSNENNEHKGGGKPPGGEWSEGPGRKSPGGSPGAKPNPNQESGAEKAAANQRKPSASGAEGAAAGATAANRNKPPVSGAEGAAAGAAASNRNKPPVSGAQGAAAGAAAANKNKPAATGAEGAALGAAAASRNNPNLNGAKGAALGAAAGSGVAQDPARYNAVRDSFDHPNLYSPEWHEQNPNAWAATSLPEGGVWAGSNLADVSQFCNYPNNSAVSYGYGDNVTNQNGNVLIDGQSVGTAEEFSQQASDLAVIGQNAKSSPNDEWLPLGVFALVRNEDQHAQLTVQLAINKQGILQGNYTDLVSDHTLPIHGSVDKETQRAAWTIGNNKNFFIESGLSNLTSGESPALIHKIGRTEKWLLIRLPKPESQDVAAAEASPEK